MALKKSEFLSALGLMFEIWRALVNEVLALGGDDEDIRRIKTNSTLRKKLAELIVASRRTVQDAIDILVDYSQQSLTDMIAAGKYDWVNSDITAENFPTNRLGGKVKYEGKLVHYGKSMSSEQVIADLDSHGLRPAQLSELLAFGAKYPDKQREFPIIALGSKWRGQYGHLFVVGLDRDGSERELGLYWFDYEWHDGCRFLAVRKS